MAKCVCGQRKERAFSLTGKAYPVVYEHNAQGCTGAQMSEQKEGHLKRWMEDATNVGQTVLAKHINPAALGASEQSDLQAWEELAALESAAREALESMLNLVCCPAFNGRVFEHDKESHRAWTLTRLSIDKLRSALKAL